MSSASYSYHVTSRVAVSCSDCGTQWMKSKYTLGEWQGRCRSCAQKVRCADPARRAQLSASARRQVIAQGGIPNAVHLTSERVRGSRNVNWRRGKSGPNHPNWKGGITPESKAARETTAYKEWRAAVFNRDSFTCRSCGEKGGRLHAHHVVAFKDDRSLRLELSNGLTLCVPCHKRTHNYGRKRRTA
jgi:hypothetical protein